MKTYIYDYETLIFKNFIDLVLFQKDPNILVQLFCGEGLDVLQSAIQTILRTLPQAICIGTTTDGEINHDRVTTRKTIVSISIFEQTTLKTA